MFKITWAPLLFIHASAQVAMDRMKKIKRQLSMTLRGGRGLDKTNGAPEQIGLDESGGGGGSDLGEAPTHIPPGEPRCGRGPLSSAPGGSADFSLSPPLFPGAAFLPHSTRILLFSFSFLHFSPFYIFFFNPLSVHLCPFPWLCVQALGGGRVPCLLQLPQGSLYPSPALHGDPPRPPGACLPWACLPRALGYLCHHLPSGPGPATISAHPWNGVLHQVTIAPTLYNLS